MCYSRVFCVCLILTMSEKGEIFHGESSKVAVKSNIVVIDPTIGDKIDKLACRLHGGLNMVRDKLKSRTRFVNVI